jgi:16S rRNA (guanine527-N7)-methyltransferase
MTPSNKDALIKFAQLLEKNALSKGLLSPNDISAKVIWQRHIENSAQLTEIIKDAKSVIDLGSGAGLPGVVLAILMPQTQFILLEKMQKRVDWLKYCATQLNLENVQVVRGAAGTEDKALKVNLTANVVVSRAVAPLKKLIPWSMQLLNANGKMVALKGKNLNNEIIDAKSLVKKCKTHKIIKTMQGSIFIARN